MNTLHKQSVCAPTEDTLSYSNIPYGYCHCGCKQKTKIIDSSDARRGRVKGKPFRYISGHYSLPRWRSRIVWIDGVRCRTVPLTKGVEAIVDILDFSRVSECLWSALKKYGRLYASTNINKKIVQMHCFILNIGISQKDIEVDHWNGNGLDNRRCNLRLSNRGQNGANQVKQRRATSSKYKGVSLFIRTSKWTAYIKVERVKIHLGYFVQERSAALAYDAAARSYFKEFAALNFPFVGERSAITGEIIQ